MEQAVVEESVHCEKSVEETQISLKQNQIGEELEF